MTLRRFEFVIEWGLFLCALLSIGTTIGIIVVLTVETASHSELALRSMG